jgi:hypothetical protein
MRLLLSVILVVLAVSHLSDAYSAAQQGGGYNDAGALFKNPMFRKGALRQFLYNFIRGAIHQLLNIILQLRILVSLPVSTLPYVVTVENYS